MEKHHLSIISDHLNEYEVNAFLKVDQKLNVLPVITSSALL